jgi:hypothetical protein
MSRAASVTLPLGIARVPKGSDDSPLDGSRAAPRLCGALLGPRAHVCAFFRDAQEEDRALLPFMQAGLAAGEKIVATIDPALRDESVRRFAAGGIEFSAAHQQGRFDLLSWTQTHLIDGTFDSGRTLAFFDQVNRRASNEGNPLTRFVTHMEWALQDGVILTDLLEYEAKANEIWQNPTGPINPVICAYDMTRFSGEVLVDIMRTHPMTLIDGFLYENPYFVSPEEFARESKTAMRVALPSHRFGNP